VVIGKLDAAARNEVTLMDSIGVIIALKDGRAQEEASGGDHGA
jgi:hypothetical protein